MSKVKTLFAVIFAASIIGGVSPLTGWAQPPAAPGEGGASSSAPDAKTTADSAKAGPVGVPAGGGASTNGSAQPPDSTQPNAEPGQGPAAPVAHEVSTSASNAEKQAKPATARGGEAKSGKAAKPVPLTTITKLRFLVKGSRTCLIFDAEGGRPKQIGPPSAYGVSVFFQQISTKLPDKEFKGGKVAAREVKFRRESGFVEVLFREKDTSASSRVQPGKNRKYTLTLELTPPSKGSKQAGGPASEAQGQDRWPPAQAGGPGSKTQQIEVKRVETSELFGFRFSQQLKNAVLGGVSPRTGSAPPPDRSPGQSRPTRPSAAPLGATVAASSAPVPFVEPDEKGLALFSSANAKFEDCSRNLVFCASEIIEAFDEALKAGPRSSQAPLALYRSGVAHALMGNYSKADKLFRLVTSQWPDHPVASPCWIGIGNIYCKKQSYLEAMEAFRFALLAAVEKEDKAAACYELGRVYLTLGANKEALEMLENCATQAPGYYTKKPDLFRLIGEAHFALGNIDKAKEHLLRYVNYQQSAPDQDIVLAKIAEIFLIQGDLGAARKMYSFIGKYYQDSEGDLICRIRTAELLEKEDLEKAISIYEDLRSKDLSPSLLRVVLIKLAALNLKKCDLAGSLDLMDEAFPVKKDGSSPGGASALREKILSNLVRQYFSDKDFMQVVQLHDKYRRVFDLIQAPDVLEQVAESYASLKFYSNALDIYDSLITKGRKKGDDVLLRCALYALRLNDGDRAFQFCKLVQSESADLKKSEILGHIFRRDRRYADAVKSFAKVLQKGKDFELEDPDSFEAYGYSLYQVGKFDEAASFLQKAMERVKVEDTYARRSILTTLSKCFSEQKQFLTAAEMMETALQTCGQNQKNELLYDISKLYVAAGRKDKAMQFLIQIKSTDDPFWGPVAEAQINTIEMTEQ